ncbi:MAG: hypothetical protein IKA08_03975 [Alphaproteobacteria bacterium]|nr:hypothetical protein [Alphaproteobacteria bacterium]
MKKQLSLFVWAVAMFGMTPVFGATNSGLRGASSADLTSGPAVRTRENVNYQKYQTRTTTRTYKQSDAGDLYYAQPSKRSDLYKQYDAASSSSAKATKNTVRTTRSEKVITKLNRKYYLAHPFFQPLGGNFGSITDLSYNQNSFDFELSDYFVEPGGEWKSNTFSIKEDFSYGITDTVALVAMAKFDMAEYKFDFDETDADSKMDDNSLSVFGIGGQWRMVDNTDWIAMASAHYQHQKDFSNNLVLELKAGYKVARSTIYGLARGWYLNLDENSYGAIVEESNGGAFYIAYDTDVKDMFYIEGGLGVFSVLNQDWTLNVEGVFGHYGWHNQASVKAALGWQPNDWFALNLYAKSSIYDSADGKNLKTYLYDPSVNTGLEYSGDAKIDNVSEMSLGVQAIFHF